MKSVFDPVTGEVDLEELARLLIPKPKPKPEKPKIVTDQGRIVADVAVSVHPNDPNATKRQGLTSLDPGYRYRPEIVRVITDESVVLGARGAGRVEREWDPFEEREIPSCHRSRRDRDYR